MELTNLLVMSADRAAAVAVAVLVIISALQAVRAPFSKVLMVVLREMMILPDAARAVAAAVQVAWAGKAAPMYQMAATVASVSPAPLLALPFFMPRAAVAVRLTLTVEPARRLVPAARVWEATDPSAVMPQQALLTRVRAVAA